MPKENNHKNNLTNKKIPKLINLTHHFNNDTMRSKIYKISNRSFQPVSYKLFSTEQIIKFSSIKTFYLPFSSLNQKFLYQSLFSITKKQSESITNSSSIFGEFFKNSDTIQLGIEMQSDRDYYPTQNHKQTKHTFFSKLYTHCCSSPLRLKKQSFQKDFLKSSDMRFAKTIKKSIFFQY